jgi:hypothetical protein
VFSLPAAVSHAVPKPKSKPKNKPPKAPRIAMRLPADLYMLHPRCVAIWDAVKADQAHFPSPYPPPAEIEADLDALALALKAAVGGSTSDTAALKVAADKVRQTFALLGAYIESVVRSGPIEDAPAIIANVLLYASNVGKRSPKPELEARDGDSAGQVVLIAHAVPQVVAYFWDFSLDQVAWTQGSQTAQANCTLASLTPGRMYYFRFRVLKRDGTTTDPSQIVSLMVR